MQSQILIPRRSRTSSSKTSRRRKGGARALPTLPPFVAKWARAIGFIMVGVSVIAGFFVHPAVGVGLAILAGGRLLILRREEQKIRAEELATASKSSTATEKLPSSVRKKSGPHGKD